MMTATVGSFGAVFNTPQAEHHLLEIDPKMYWIGIREGAAAGDGGRRFTYSLGQGDAGEPTEFPDQETPDRVIAALRERLAQEPGAVHVRIRADRNLPAELIIQTLTSALDSLRGETAGKVSRVYTEVSQKERS
jgi:hypothetical protein